MDSKANPYTWPEIFKTWSGPVATVAGAVATLLVTTLRIADKHAQIAGYVIVLVLLGTAVFISHRVRKKQHLKAAREERRRTWLETKQRTAFRGLYPYGVGDRLPGSQRQREAGRLVVQLLDPSFTFGILCGDSGCGKTSLLRSEVQNKLKEETVKGQQSLRILYLANTRYQSQDLQRRGGEDGPFTKLDQRLETLKTSIQQASAGSPLILIIDQFEELFIEFTQAEERTRIGRFINDQIHSAPPVRILAAIRRDYLVDVRDLAPALPDPLSMTNLFSLKNFTIDEASDVINECAEFDGLTPDDDFARTLATDLAEGGFVRPPELQIVCTALAGTLTLNQYERSGGASGILSHYIGDAVDLSDKPNLARQLLRALCDFSSHAKRRPQTVNALAEQIGSPQKEESSKEQAAITAIRIEDQIVNILQHLETARIVAVDGREAPQYSLVHDYLVDPVWIATTDVSTQTEDANRTIQYYAAEYRRDRRTRLPLLKDRHIRKYADRKLLQDPTVLSLMKASLISHILTFVGLPVLSLLIAALIYGYVTTRLIWATVSIQNHFKAGESGGSLDTNVQASTHAVFTGTGGTTSNLTHARQWDLKTAQLLQTVEGKKFVVSRKGRFLAYTYENGQVVIRNLETRQDNPLPYVFKDKPDSWSSLSMVIGFSRSEDVLSYTAETPGETKIPDNSDTASSLETPKTVVLHSTVSFNQLAKLDNCPPDGTIFNASVINERLAELRCKKDKATQLFLWRGDSLPMSSMHERPGSRILARDFSPNYSLLGTIEKSPDNKATIELWDTASATHLRSSSPFSSVDDSSLFFSRDGQYIVITKRDKVSKLFRVSDLQPETLGATDVYSLDVGLDNDELDHYTIWQSNPTDAVIRKIGAAESRVLKNFPLRRVGLGADDDDENPNNELNKILIDPTESWIVVLIKESHAVELWDLRRGTKLQALNVGGPVTDVDLTYDGHAIEVMTSTNSISLFGVGNGEKIMEISGLSGINSGDGGFIVYYDAPCNVVNVWTSDGKVISYRRGYEIFGNKNWFIETSPCKAGPGS